MIKDLAIEHSYYCSDHNYYNNDTNFHFDNWEDFMCEMGDADLDYNLLFRWDVKFDDERNQYYMELFYMLQRKGAFLVYTVDLVSDDDEKSIREFLAKYWDYMAELWKPINE